MKSWIIGPGYVPTGKDNFAFVHSTGRCGTLHLARVFGDNDSYVCHEEEHKKTYLVMEEFLRPIAKSNDQQLAMRFVCDYRIPHMVRNLRMTEAVNYFDTGH